MIQNLQALRAIAAYMVVVHHLGSGYLRREIGLDWPHFGASGVDIFFVLSGFIMAHTAADQDAQPKSFLERRFIRVVPLYWAITLTIYALCMMGLEANGLSRSDGTVAHLLQSMFFWPFTRASGDNFPLLTVGWTLNFEMLFYLLFALSLAGRKRFKPVLAVLSMLAALIALSLAVTPSWPLAAQFFFSPILAEFAFGIMLAVIVRYFEKIPLMHLRVLGTALLVVGAGGIAATAIIGMETESKSWQRMLVWGVPAMAMVASALTLEYGGLVIRNRFVLFQGDASYAVYLVHLLVIQILVTALHTVFHPASPALVVGIALFLLFATAVIGSLVHILIERPTTSFLRSVWGGRKAKLRSPFAI